MKNLSIILAAFSMGTAPILADSKAASSSQIEQTEEIQKSGKVAIQSIRQAYEDGDYDQFLKEMDDAYQAATEQNRLEMLGDTRGGISLDLKKWEAKTHLLQLEKNKALFEAIQNQDPSPFVEKVQSAISDLTNDQQLAAIDRLAMFRQMAPGTGQNSDENLMIDIDLEYEFKALHLSMPGASVFEKREKQCALKMEKLDRIQQFAKQFQDKSLKQDIAIYAEQFDDRLAQSWDIADLQAIASGKMKPTNALEEQVSSIFSLYQEKFSELTKQLIADYEKN